MPTTEEAVYLFPLVRPRLLKQFVGMTAADCRVCIHQVTGFCFALAAHRGQRLALETAAGSE